MTLKEALREVVRLLTAKPTKRLYIPSLFIAVPLYPSDGHNAQEITDRSASAVWLEWRCCPVIADHRGQRFYRLPNAKPDRTTAFVREVGKAEQAFICKAKYLALIKNNTLLRESDNFDVRDLQGVDLVMYTCSGAHINGCTEVWVTEWGRKEE